MDTVITSILWPNKRILTGTAAVCGTICHSGKKMQSHHLGSHRFSIWASSFEIASLSLLMPASPQMWPLHQPLLQYDEEWGIWRICSEASRASHAKWTGRGEDSSRKRINVRRYSKSSESVRERWRKEDGENERNGATRGVMTKWEEG